jgi:hypothetical protein
MMPVPKMKLFMQRLSEKYKYEIFFAVDAQRFGGLPEYVNQLKRENVR